MALWKYDQYNYSSVVGHPIPNWGRNIYSYIFIQRILSVLTIPFAIQSNFFKEKTKAVPSFSKVHFVLCQWVLLFVCRHFETFQQILFSLVLRQLISRKQKRSKAKSAQLFDNVKMHKISLTKFLISLLKRSVYLMFNTQCF